MCVRRDEPGQADRCRQPWAREVSYGCTNIVLLNGLQMDLNNLSSCVLFLCIVNAGQINMDNYREIVIAIDNTGNNRSAQQLW